MCIYSKAAQRIDPTPPSTTAAHLGEQQDRVEIGVDDDGELFGRVLEGAGLPDAPADIVHQDVQGAAEALFRLRGSGARGEKWAKVTKMQEEGVKPEKRGGG